MAFTYTPEQIEFVKTAWLKKTHTLEELALHCNTSIASVRMKLVKMGAYNKEEKPTKATTQVDQPAAKRQKGQIGPILAFQETKRAQEITPNPFLQKSKLTKKDIQASRVWFEGLPILFQNPPF